jgi:hypothetical protein
MQASNIPMCVYTSSHTTWPLTFLSQSATAAGQKTSLGGLCCAQPKVRTSLNSSPELSKLCVLRFRLHACHFCDCVRLSDSVADPGCLSQIPDPGFYPCHTFFCRQKFHKILNYFIFEMKEKNLGQFSKNYGTFYPKNCH